MDQFRISQGSPLSRFSDYARRARRKMSPTQDLLGYALSYWISLGFTVGALVLTCWLFRRRNSAGSGSNGRKSKKHRQSSRQSKGSGSDNGDQLSDDSLNTGNHSRSSSRPGSASRRRKKPASRAADVAAKRHRAGHSSEEYATSDDSLYSEDSLTQERHHRGAEQDGASTTAQEIASISNSVQQLTAAIDASASGTSVDPPSASAALQVGNSTGTDQPDMPDTATQTSNSTAGMGVSPVSIWSSEDMHLSTPVDWSTSHCGVQTVSEQNSVSTTNRRSWNLSITPVDMWTSPAALEALKLSDSDSELGNTTDSGIDVRRFRAGNRWGEPGQAEGMTTEGFQQMSHLSSGDPDRTPSPSSPRVRTEEVHTFPGASAAANQGKKPVKFEVTINEDNTKILYNVEKTEYKTYALKDKSPEAGSSGSTSSIPDAIKISMTQTKMIHTDDRSENVRREQILMQSSDSSASDGERIVSQKMLRAKHLYERDLETSGEDISRESSVERQFLDKDYSSYVTGSLQPALSGGQDNVDTGAASKDAALMAGTDLPSMGDQDSGLDTMIFSDTPDSSLAFQYGDGRQDAYLAAMTSRCVGTTTSGNMNASPTWQFPQLVIHTSRKTQQGQVPEDYAVAVALNNSLNFASSFDAKRRSCSQERRQASDELDASGDLSQSRMSSTELRSASEGRIPTSTASSFEAASARALSQEVADLSSPSVTTTSLKLGFSGDGSVSSALSGSASVQGSSHSTVPGHAQDGASQGLSATSFLSSSLEKLQNMVEETFPLDDAKGKEQRASEGMLINQDSVRIGVIVTTSPRSDTSPRVLDHSAQGLISHHHHPPVPHSFAYSQWISEHESQPSFTVAGARSNVAGPIDLGLPRRSSIPQMAALTVSGGAAHATAGGLEPAVRDVAQARVSSLGHPLHVTAGYSGVYGGAPTTVTQSSLVRDVVPGTWTLGSSTAHSAQPAPTAQLSYEVRETDTEHILGFHSESSSFPGRNTTDPRASGSMHVGSSLTVPKSRGVNDDLETVSEHTVEFVDEGSSTLGHESQGKGTHVKKSGESTLPASQEGRGSSQRASPEESEDDEKVTESEHSITFHYEGTAVSGSNTAGVQTSSSRPESFSVPLSTDHLGSDQKSPFTEIAPGERETIIEHSVHYIDEGLSRLDENTADLGNLKPDQRGSATSASHQGTGTTQDVPPAQTNKGENTEKVPSRQLSEEDKENVSEYTVDFYDEGSTMHGDRTPSGQALRAQQKVPPVQTTMKGESTEKVPSRQQSEEEKNVSEYTVDFYDEGSTIHGDRAPSGLASRDQQKVSPAQTIEKKESTEKVPSRQLSEEDKETVSEYTVNFYDEGSTMHGDRTPSGQALRAQQKVPPVQTTMKGESTEKVPSRQQSEEEKNVSEYTVDFYDEGSTMHGDRTPSGQALRAQQKVPPVQTTMKGESTEKVPSRQQSEEDKENVSEYTVDFYDEGSTMHGDRTPSGQALRAQQKVPPVQTTMKGESTEKVPSRQQSEEEKNVSEYTVDFYDEGSTIHGDRAPSGLASRDQQKVSPAQTVEKKESTEKVPSRQLSEEDKETVSEYTVNFYDEGSTMHGDRTPSGQALRAQQKVPPVQTTMKGESTEKVPSRQQSEEEKTVSEYTVNFYDEGSTMHGDRTPSGQASRAQQKVPPAQIVMKGESKEKVPSRQQSEEEKTVSEYTVDVYDEGSTMHANSTPSRQVSKAQQKVQSTQTIKKGESMEKVPPWQLSEEDKETVSEYTVDFYDEGSTMQGDRAPSGRASRDQKRVPPVQTTMEGESTEKVQSRQLSEENKETFNEYTVDIYDEGSTVQGDNTPRSQQKVPSTQTIKEESTENVPSRQISEEEKESISEYTVDFCDEGSTIHGDRPPSGQAPRAQQKVQTAKKGESTENVPSRQLSAEEKETVSEYTVDFYDEGSTVHGDRAPSGQALRGQQKVPSTQSIKTGESTEKVPSRQISDEEKETVSEYTVKFYDEGSTSLDERTHGGQSSSALQKMPSATAHEQKPADPLAPPSRQEGGQVPKSPISQLPGEERETTSEYTVDFYDGGSSYLEDGEGSSVDGPLASQEGSPSKTGLGSAQRGQSAGHPDGEKETVSEYTVDFYDGGSVRTDDVPAGESKSSKHRQNAQSPTSGEQGSVQKSPSKQTSDKERETVSEYSVDFYDEGSSYLGSDMPDRRVPVPQQKGPSSLAASQEGAKAQKPPGQQLTDEDQETVSEYTINLYDEGSTNLGDRKPVVSLQRGSAQQDQRAGPSQGGSAGESKGATSSYQQTVHTGSAGSGAKQTRGGHDGRTPTASAGPQPSSSAPSTLQSGPVVILSRTTSPHGRLSSTEIKKGAPPSQVDFMTLEKGATLIRPKTSSSLSPLSRSPRQSQSSSGRSTPRKSGSEKASNSEEETCFEEVIEIAAPDMKYYLGSNKFPDPEVTRMRTSGADVGRDRPGSVSTSSESSNYRTPLQSPRVYASPSHSPRSPHGGSSSPVGGVSSLAGQAQEGMRVSRESFDLRPGSVYTSGSESDYQSPRSHISGSTPPLHPLGLRTGASLASGSESDFFSPRSTVSETNEDSSGEMTARPSQTARETKSAVDASLAQSPEDEGSSVDPRREDVAYKQLSGSDLVTSAALSSPVSTASDRSSVASTSAISTSTSSSEKPMHQLHPGSTALPSKMMVAGRAAQPTREEQELLAALENENIRENLKREVEKRIASLQRRVRSLSDSAISSDFTDVESNSVSPRSSRLREGEKPFGEVGIAFSDRNIFVGHAAASLNSSYPRGQGMPGLGAPEAWKSAGLKQADSGNVYDGEDGGSDASSTIVASPEPPGDGSFDSRLSLNSEASRGAASRSQDDGEVDKYLRTSRLDSARDRPEIKSGEADGRVSGLHKMLASPDYRTFRQGLLLDQQQDSAVGGGRQLPTGMDHLDRGNVENRDALHPEMVTTHRNISQSSDQSEGDPFNMSKGWIGGEMAGRFHGLFELGERDQPSARMPRMRRQMSSYRPMRSEDVWYTLPPSTEHCEQQRHQLTVSNPWSFEKCFIYQPRPQGRYPERLIDAILAIHRYPLLQSLSASTLRRPGSKKPGPRFRGRRTRSLDDLPGVAHAAALRSLMEVTYRQHYPHGVSQYPSSGSFEITSQRMSSPSGTEHSLPLSGYGDGASASASGGPEGVTMPPRASLLQRGLFMGDLTQSLPDREHPSGQILRQLPPRVLYDEDLLYQCYRRSSQVSQRPLSPEEIRLARQAVEELLLNVPWEDYRSGRAGASATETTTTSGRQPSYSSTAQSGDASTSFHDSGERHPELERYESQDDSNLQSPKEASMEHNSSSDSITFVFVGKSQRNEDMQPDGEMVSPISAEFRTDDDSCRGRSVSEYSTASSDPEESTGYRGQHTFWPISERSVSSDNIPKQLEKPMTLHRSRSASLLDVETAVDDFQGSIFPSHPVDTDRESVSSRRSSSISCLYDNSDYPSSRPSPSVDRWRDVRDGSLDSDRASDVDKAREQTLEEEESQPSTATGSGGDASDGSLLTPGRNATSTPLTPSPMASPSHLHRGQGISLSIQTSDEALAQGRGFYLDEHGLQLPHSHRPTSSHSARGTSRLSRRLSYSDSNLYIRHRRHHQADQAAFAIGSSDSLLLIGTSSSGPGTDFLDSTGEGADSHHVTGLYKTHSLNLVGAEGRQASDIGAEEVEGPSWYTLSAMMLETTSLLKSIQERIPGTSLSSASSPPASASNGSVVHRGRMCESGVQTGGSLSDVHSAEMQTETEVVMVDSVTSTMDSASLDDFNSPLLHSSETQTSESGGSSVARSVQTASQMSMADSSSMTEAAQNQTVGTDAGSFLGEAETSYTGAWAAQLYSTSQDKPVHTAEAAVGDEPVESTPKSTAEAAVGADSDTTTSKPPKSDKLRSSRRKKLEHADSFSQTETDADYIHFLVAQDREHQRQSPKLSPRSLEMEAGKRSTTPTRLLRPLSRARSADVEGYGERVSPVSLGLRSRDSSSQTDQISLHTVGTDSMPEDKAVSTDGLQVNSGTDPFPSVSSRVSQHSIGVQKNDFRTVGLSTRDDQQYHDVKTATEEDSISGMSRVMASMSSQTEADSDSASWASGMRGMRESPSGSPSKGRDSTDYSSTPTTDAEVQALASGDADDSRTQLDPSQMPDIPGYNSNDYIMAEISKLKEEHTKMMQLLERTKGQQSRLSVNTRDGKFRSSDSNPSEDVSPVTVIERTALSPQGDMDSPPNLDQRLPSIIGGRTSGQSSDQSTQMDSVLGGRSYGSGVEGLQLGSVAGDKGRSGSMGSEGATSQQSGSGVDRALLYLSSTSSARSGSSRSSDMQGEDIVPSSLLGSTISDRVSTHLGLRQDQVDSSASSLFKPVPVHSSDKQSRSSGSSRRSTGSQADSSGRSQRDVRSQHSADISHTASHSSSFRSLSSDRLGRMHPGSFVDAPRLHVPGRSSSADATSSSEATPRNADSSMDSHRGGRQGDVVGDILSDDASVTPRMSPVADQLEDQDSWLSTSSLDSSLRRFISTGVEVAVDSSDEFTQTDMERGGAGRVVATTTEGIQVELERLQKERLQIIELLSLNYLPSSLTVELLEAKLNYCIGQTDMLLSTLDENAALSEEHRRPDYSRELAVISEEYLTRYRHHFQQDKQDIAACMEALQHSQQGGGRGRRRTRNRDLRALRRRAEIEAFKLERQREQQLHERARSASPYQSSAPSPDSSGAEFSPSYMTPRQLKNHLLGLRKTVVQASQEELRSRSLSPFLDDRSLSPDYQPQSVYSSRESSLSLGFTPESSPSPEPRRDSFGVPPRSRSLGSHSSSTESGLNRSVQMRSLSSGSRSYRFYSPTSRLYPRHSFPSRLAAASWSLDPQALLEETAAIRHRNRLQISQAHRSIRTSDVQRSAISSRYHSSSHLTSSSGVRPHSPSVSAITDEEIDKELESLKKEHKEYTSRSPHPDRDTDPLRESPGSPYASYAAYARDLLARSERSISQTLQSRGVRSQTPLSQTSTDLDESLGIPPPPYEREERYAHSRPVSSRDIRAHIQQRRSQSSPFRP